MDERNENLCNCIQRLTQGDISALDEIYERIGKVLLSIAWSILGNKMDAEDVVHDAFIQLVKKASSFRVKKNPFGWICTIVRNLAMDKVRKKKRENDFAREYETETRTAEDSDVLMYEVFQHLTQKEGELIRLRYWYKYSLSEIANTLHMRKSTVEYQIKRAENKIRDFYEKI